MGLRDAVCCSVLRCITVCCSVMQCVAARVASHVANTLDGTQRCSELYCVAVYYSMLQRVAVCCSACCKYSRWDSEMQCVAVCCGVSQYVAV